MRTRRRRAPRPARRPGPRHHASAAIEHRPHSSWPEDVPPAQTYRGPPPPLREAVWHTDTPLTRSWPPSAGRRPPSASAGRRPPLGPRVAPRTARRAGRRHSGPPGPPGSDGTRRAPGPARPAWATGRPGTAYTWLRSPIGCSRIRAPFPSGVVGGIPAVSSARVIGWRASAGSCTASTATPSRGSTSAPAPGGFPGTAGSLRFERTSW